MDWQTILANVLSPAALFFFLGFLAVLLRSDLEIPHPLPKLFSLYLLLSIGYTGGAKLAHAGLTLAQAQAEHGADACELWRQDLVHSDRARADGQTDGAILIVTAKKRIVGAHILAPAAGEMIHELALAISQGMKLDELASLVHVYPTVAIGVQQLAAEAAYDKAGKYRWLVRKG